MVEHHRTHPSRGNVGSTAATLTGTLGINPGHTVNNGTVLIFAPTATEAAIEALSGTISVEFEGETVEYFFGPDSVGDVSDHKAFAVSVSGSDVVILLEDMADFPDATPDWDYNDQSWEVTVMGSSAPDIYDGEFTWTGPSGSATVTVNVTAIDPDTYKWNYHVFNDSFMFEPNGHSVGMGHFSIGLFDSGAVESSGNTVGAVFSVEDVEGGDAITWQWGGTDSDEVPELMPGEEADFYITTDALPVDESTGDMGDPETTISGGGGAVSPGEKPEVMITDKDGNPVGVNTLRVAKWENAFMYSKYTNFQMTPKPVDAATGYDIIDLDPDHFIVWVRDNKKWTDGVPRITANVSTDNEPSFRAYNDPSSVIDLVRCTGTDSKNGWYMSDSQMLVSNRVDDTDAIPGVGSDESGLGILGPTKSGGFSWRRADRTHQIALGGTVGVTYAFDQVGGNIVKLGNVIVRSSIKSHVNILNAPNGLVDSGVGVVSKYTVYADFRRANEQYAQVGVRLLKPTVAENVPWPANVNLSDGLYSATPTGEVAALLVTAKLFTQATDDIELYYVNYDEDSESKGVSFIEADEAKGLPNGFKDNIVIFNRDYTTFTLPHEIGGSGPRVVTNSV